MFIDQLERKDGGFDHQVAKIPEDEEREKRSLLRPPEAISDKAGND
jgi:hypothetical protein